MTNVKGKWALITGASRGVGRLMAQFMADHGCNLVLHARSLEHLAALAEELRSKGVAVETVAAELSSEAEVTRMLDELEARKLVIDILFNNAAVQIAYRTEFFQTPVSDFTTSFMINTIAPAMIVYRLLPGMIQRGFGRIVNTTSGIRDEPEQAAYSASKAALDKFTKDLKKVIEGTDVMMNITDPGWCRTDLGGPQAPNAPQSALPGLVLGAFLDDKKSGRLIPAQDFAGMSLEAALQKAAKDL